MNQEKISRTEAYNLLTENDINLLNEKLNEIAEYVYNTFGSCQSFDVQFYYDKETNDIFLEVVSSENKVLYRFVFKADSRGRKAIGVTKKYSISLPKNYYHAFDFYLYKNDLKASEFLRKLICDFIDKKGLLKKYELEGGDIK